MIKAAVCDEDIDFLKEIERWVITESKKQDFCIENSCYRVEEELFWGMETDGGYDIIIIGAKGQSEIHMAKQIVKENPHCLIIFAAEDEAMAYETFDVHPFSFLKKPVDRKKFCKVFIEACEKIGRVDEIFRVRSDRVYYQIPMNDIVYFQSEKRKIRLFNHNGEELLFINTLNDVEEYVKTLSSDFIRIHHSYLINRIYIRKYRYEEMELINGIKLPISDGKRKDVRDQMQTGNKKVTGKEL